MSWPVGKKQSPETIAKRLQSLRRPLAVRFEKHFTPEPNSGCWLWFGATDSRGYGQMRIAKRARHATHVSLELVGRTVPTGMQACHHCDTPECVNPEHLFIGTMKDNVADMMAKGRHDHSGLELGRGKQVAEELKTAALERYRAGEPFRAIGKALGVSPTAVLGWAKEIGHKTRPAAERTHCPQGHPYSGANLMRVKRGDRVCRICMRAARLRYEARVEARHAT